jgi:glyceraldehyde 3-phosphate dehydrogenase
VTRIGINGFGRIGRLAARVIARDDRFDLVQVNDPNADAITAAHLFEFDSVHGRWHGAVEATSGSSIEIDGREVACSAGEAPGEVDWSAAGVEVVLECSGRFRKVDLLEPFFERGVERVVVSAPVHDESALNVVVGVNDDLFDPEVHRVVTAASCTTNCLAPVVKVLHEGLGIRHGSITTMHDLTNTQVIVDAPHRDLRRARAAGLSLIPTSTGSATAIGLIFPELEGRLDGLAVRVPLLNSSLTDCVFEVARSTDRAEVNGLLEEASRGDLEGILGFEARPLVSVDFRGDPRSGVVDGPSTMVTGETQIKVLAWYDNEWGYANRMVDLVGVVAGRSA